ncbi:FAD-dependent monooxygenase [Rhodococcoides corynebacterioides]|uniref:FAD-dependent monooxygenase n=1 Tax=Rhodococcoides corynebacterioides TaxID=53972 RepID=UPI001C9AF00C|nr:FAD-dependent monooxygenase [Rhodococcus corynebacterioides]MBY6349002.1 FAD-dependent monooxygenase [Rhodococcus corynebacterioides]
MNDTTPCDTEHSATTLDVLIVGGGPAGTTMAIELIRRGLTVRVVDKAPGGFPGSRAKGIQPRTQEIFEDMGLLAGIHAGGSTYPRMGIHAGPITVPWATIKTNTPTDAVPYPSTWLIPQFRTDQVLHDRLAALGGRIDYDHDVLTLTQNDTKVTVFLVTPHGEETVSARYVVGADGGSSIVRRSLGIEFEGTTDETDRMLIVDAEVDGDLTRNRWHIWPLGGAFVGACPLPDTDLMQWMITLDPDEEAPTTAADITARIRTRTKKNITLTRIAWRSVFRPNIRIAQSYRQGRAFLVGDAAHVHPPAGAQGLNTGVQDSYNLAWKLAQVLDGADDALLDTYQDERQPIAATVLGISAQKYAGIASASPASLKRGKDEYQLAVSYHGGPLAPADSDRTSTLSVGDRAPDAVLDVAGTPARLFDFFRGTHFTAITYGLVATGTSPALDWPGRGAALHTVAIDAPGQIADHQASDTRGNFRRTYGLDGPTTLFIRPDGYIAGIVRVDRPTTLPASVRTVAGMLRTTT